MPQTQFIPSPLKIIERRRCQNCGARMMMTGIEPMGLGTDRRTFECDQCGHEEELLVKFRALQASRRAGWIEQSIRSIKGTAHDNTE